MHAKTTIAGLTLIAVAASLTCPSRHNTEPSRKLVAVPVLSADPDDRLAVGFNDDLIGFVLTPPAERWTEELPNTAQATHG